MFGDKFDGANGDAKGVDTLIEGVDVFAWGLTHKWVRLMHDGVVRGGKSLRLNACFNFTNSSSIKITNIHTFPHLAFDCHELEKVPMHFALP
jgi:hypothetical protein